MMNIHNQNIAIDILVRTLIFCLKRNMERGTENCPNNCGDCYKQKFTKYKAMKTKLIKILSVVVVLVLTLTSATSAATAAEVRLYRHRDFQGEFQRLNAGGASVGPITPRLKNRVSSLRVPQGFEVTLTDDEGNRSRTFKRSAAYVGDSMNDRADSYGITQICQPNSPIC